MTEFPTRQHYWNSPYVTWHKEVPSGSILLIFYMRTARHRAKVVGIVEALCLLWDLEVVALAGGPLAESKGVFWIAAPSAVVHTALSRLPLIGYTAAVDLVEPVTFNAGSDMEARKVRWRGNLYQLIRVYEEDSEQIIQESPDKRVFLIEKGGDLVEIQGYRGDGGEFSRRALPVADARMLVNLVSCTNGSQFLDPFAGAGGIIIEAVKRGLDVTSVDIDPILRHGLEAMGARHYTADASKLPFPNDSFHAIATEPPYHDESESFMAAAFHEMYRVLASRGRLVVLCAAWQANLLRDTANGLRMNCFLDLDIDRKGLAVNVLAWKK